MKKVIVIPNLDTLQHYKDRRIAWIKLYLDILQDYRFQQLEDDERWIYLGLILLAVKNDNKIPKNDFFITENICFRKKNNLKRVKKFRKTILKLKKLGLISVKLLSECYQGDCLDKIRKEEIRKEEDIFSSEELITAYKKGKPLNNLRPHFWGSDMRWKEGEQKWFVLKDGSWLEFAGKESEIEWL